MTKKKKIMQLSGKNEKSLDNLYITSFCSIFFIKKKIMSFSLNFIYSCKFYVPTHKRKISDNRIYKNSTLEDLLM